MNFRAAVFWGFCGVAAGAAIGLASVPLPNRAPKISPQASSSDRTNSVGSAPVRPDGSERLVRLFSAYQEPMELRRNSQIFEALRDLQPADFQAVAERAHRLEVSKRGELLDPLLKQWFKVDSAGAQAWLLANPKAFYVDAWAEADPEAALKAALTAPKIPARQGWPFSLFARFTEMISPRSLRASTRFPQTA
jgi:hypothetical protein